MPYRTLPSHHPDRQGSRDGKAGNAQIEYGLTCDPEGRPVAVEVFAGNTADPTAFISAAATVKQRFGLADVVTVGDRGMITTARIDALKHLGGLGWITSLRAPAIAALAAGGVFQLSLFDEQNLAEITHPDYPDDCLVASPNGICSTGPRCEGRGPVDRATDGISIWSPSRQQHPRSRRSSWRTRRVFTDAGWVERGATQTHAVRVASSNETGDVITIDELRDAVDAAFAETSRGLRRWPDPHPDRRARDEEYSRVSDATKWRIVGARAEAWIAAVDRLDIATVERDADVAWVHVPGSRPTTATRLVPAAAGALPLVIARSQVDDIPETGITVGVGGPTVLIASIPDCGCDACDSGSDNEIAYVDQVIGEIVAHHFRRLTRGNREIIAQDGRLRRSTGSFARGEQERVLADPAGWDELAGDPWL